MPGIHGTAIEAVASFEVRKNACYVGRPCSPHLLGGGAKEPNPSRTTGRGGESSARRREVVLLLLP